MVSLYLNLKCERVNQILFINDVEEASIVKHDMESGKRRIFCDLEHVMLKDIKTFYTNRDKIIAALPPKVRVKVKRDEELLKVEDMEHTQRFIKGGNIYQAVFGVLLEMVFTYSSSIAYFFMILSMIIDAGFISVLYPISLFAYALMEEERPGKTYWQIIIVYSLFVLILKFIFQMDVLLTIDGLNTTVTNMDEWALTGLRRVESSFGMFVYILPQLGILFTVML